MSCCKRPALWQTLHALPCNCSPSAKSLCSSLLKLLTLQCASILAERLSLVLLLFRKQNQSQLSLQHEILQQSLETTMWLLHHCGQPCSNLKTSGLACFEKAVRGMSDDLYLLADALDELSANSAAPPKRRRCSAPLLSISAADAEAFIVLSTSKQKGSAQRRLPCLSLFGVLLSGVPLTY